ETVAPTATSRIEFRGNLNSNEKEHTADTIIKDSLGNSYTVTFEFEKGNSAIIGTGGNSVRGTIWTLSVKRITNQATGNYVEFNGTDDENIINVGNSVTLFFDEYGKIRYIGDDTPAQLDDLDNFDTVFLNLNNLTDITSGG